MSMLQKYALHSAAFFKNNNNNIFLKRKKKKKKKGIKRIIKIIKKGKQGNNYKCSSVLLCVYRPTVINPGVNFPRNG